MNSILPTKEKNIITDGYAFQANTYCKKNCAKGKCVQFYASLPTQTSIITCPHGFSVCVYYTKFGDKLVFPSLKIDDTFDNKKISAIKPYLGKEPFVNLSRNHLITIIENEINTISAKEQLTNISHDIKNIDAQIKEHCEKIFNQFDFDERSHNIQREEIAELYNTLKTIYICSSIIHSRYTMINYENDNKSSEKETIVLNSIYKKFDKMRRVFKGYKSKNVTISINGASYSKLRAGTSFEMIPLLILENAIKYSRENSYVSIDFNENGNLLTVEVASFTPYCSREELTHIFEKGFRGKNARSIANGSGLGLYFVKKLCDSFGIQIEASSSDKITPYNDVPYSTFTIKLTFNNICE